MWLKIGKYYIFSLIDEVHPTYHTSKQAIENANDTQ
jgi:hypothetical protein